MGNRAVVGNLEEFLKFKQHNLTFIRIVTVCSFFVWLAAYLQTWFIIHKSQIILNVNGKSTGALLLLLLLQRFLFERFYLNHSLQLFFQLAKVNRIFHSGSSRALQLLSGLLTNNFCLLSLPHLSGTSQWNNRFVVCCRCFCCVFLHYKNFSSRENRSERMSPLFFYFFTQSLQGVSWHDWTISTTTFLLLSHPVPGIELCARCAHENDASTGSTSRYCAWVRVMNFISAALLAFPLFSRRPLINTTHDLPVLLRLHHW